MRRVPDRVPVPDQDGLGSLVLHSEPGRGFVRDASRVLDHDQPVNDIWVRLFQVRFKLLKSSGADRTGQAMLEQ